MQIVPEDVLVEAVANRYCGIQVIHVLEGGFNQIDLIESLMVKCVHTERSYTMEFLLSRTKPAQMAHKVLISAIKNQESGVYSRVAEKFLHIPITIDILESAADYGDPELFQFLWNQCHRPSVPEDLFDALSRNRRYGFPLQQTLDMSAFLRSSRIFVNWEALQRNGSISHVFTMQSMQPQRTH